jgi:hypothetical protein
MTKPPSIMAIGSPGLKTLSFAGSAASYLS